MKPGNGTEDRNLERSQTLAGGGARQLATRPRVSRGRKCLQTQEDAPA